jgi:hypothetical protein
MAKTWAYRGRVIEEDFESWSDPGRMLKHRTGYIIQASGYEQHGNYVPGKFRTLVEAKRGVDEVIQVVSW